MCDVFFLYLVLVQFSCVRLFVTPWIAARQASLSITNSWSSLRLTPIESVMPSSHLILGRPLLLLPPIPPSIKVFSIESTLGMRWPKYWSFSFIIIPSKEIPGLISFRRDWFNYYYYRSHYYHFFCNCVIVQMQKSDGYMHILSTIQCWIYWVSVNRKWYQLQGDYCILSKKEKGLPIKLYPGFLLLPFILFGSE